MHDLIERRAMLVGARKKSLERAIDQPRTSLIEIVIAETDRIHSTGRKFSISTSEREISLRARSRPRGDFYIECEAASIAIEADEEAGA